MNIYPFGINPFAGKSTDTIDKLRSDFEMEVEDLSRDADGKYTDDNVEAAWTDFVAVYRSQPLRGR